MARRRLCGALPTTGTERKGISVNNERQVARSIVIPKWRAHDVREWGHLYAEGGELNHASATLINLTPVLGVSRITEENLRDVWLRLAALQSMVGAVLWDGAGGPVYFTRADVERHIGLETEARDKTLVDFMRYALRLTVDERSDLFRSANAGRTALEKMGVGDAFRS